MPFIDLVRVSISLLEPKILRHAMKIIAADDDGVPHLARGDDKPLEDTATDGNVASKRALFYPRRYLPYLGRFGRRGQRSSRNASPYSLRPFSFAYAWLQRGWHTASGTPSHAAQPP